tara:strand:- start:279 stop:542 length:264 start_codon:yes stop_codon:yes gene_type:complete
MKYKFKVQLTHLYTQTEEVDIFIDSSDPLDAAEDAAGHQADMRAKPTSFRANFKETEIDEISLTQADPEEGEEPIPVRCDKTEDLFS